MRVPTQTILDAVEVRGQWVAGFPNDGMTRVVDATDRNIASRRSNCSSAVTGRWSSPHVEGFAKRARRRGCVQTTSWLSQRRDTRLRSANSLGSVVAQSGCAHWSGARALSRAGVSERRPEGSAVHGKTTSGKRSGARRATAVDPSGSGPPAGEISRCRRTLRSPKRKL